MQFFIIEPEEIMPADEQIDFEEETEQNVAVASQNTKYHSSNNYCFWDKKLFFCFSEAVELDIRRYGFKATSDSVKISEGIISLPNGDVSLEKVVEFLSNAYCNYSSAEFEHLEVRVCCNYFLLLNIVYVLSQKKNENGFRASTKNYRKKS